jgi:predicted ATP-grasp superfamily ATP-dependent carboligase
LKLYLFADKDIEIDIDFAWPNWTADLPNQDLTRNRILKDAPICSVLAEAETAELAFINLLERAKQLREMMR